MIKQETNFIMVGHSSVVQEGRVQEKSGRHALAKQNWRYNVIYLAEAIIESK
jgi:hypothetical protein